MSAFQWHLTVGNYLAAVQAACREPLKIPTDIHDRDLDSTPSLFSIVHVSGRVYEGS